MANSRRRERELARRRYERRRLREMEQRAKRRQRNIVMGAALATLAVIGGIVWLAIALSGGGSKAKPAAQVSATPTTSTSPTPPPAAPAKCAKISPNPPSKGQPKVPDVKGKAPSKLVIKDVSTGHGPAAKKGADVSVTYIGISCSTGKVFDASYLHGSQPFHVKPVGRAAVIQGWNDGLLGVKAGGVRELIIPASLGYGVRGSPPTIQPNETLIFLITVKSVKNA